MLAIVSSIEFDRANVDVALGLLEFLNYKHFIGAGIDTAVHSVAGSREENAIFVSNLYSHMNRDHYWWERQSLMSESGDIERWREWWKAAFQNSANVSEVH